MKLINLFTTIPIQGPNGLTAKEVFQVIQKVRTIFGIIQIKIMLTVQS